MFKPSILANFKMVLRLHAGPDRWQRSSWSHANWARWILLAIIARPGLRRSRLSICRLLGLAVAACFLLTPAPARADSYWNVASGDWSVATNWTAGVPNSAAYIVNGGTATVASSEPLFGGLSLGNSAGSGSIVMTAGGFIGAPDGPEETIGDSGIGVFTQSGGTNMAGNTFILGNQSGSTGIYNLSGTGLLQAYNCEFVAYFGMGTFTQSGGTNTVGTLWLASESGGNGAYTLSGSGQLSAGAELMGYSGGTSIFRQSGGTNTTGDLAIPYSQDSLHPGSGTYYLSSIGQLSATSEYIGQGGAGNFTQSGGTNTAEYINLSGGRYLLSAGVLQVAGGLQTAGGTLDGGGGSAVILAGSSSLVDLSGSIVNTVSTSLSVGANSLLIVAPGFNPATAFRGYTNLGLTHTAGTTLTVAAGQGFGGWGSIADPVVCQGWITVMPGSSINLQGGLNISGTGAVNLGSGNITTSNSSSGMTSGLLVSGGQFVGGVAAGTFTQSGGSNTIGSLSLGCNYPGTYNLLGGQLTASTESLGTDMFAYSIGAFMQTGGTNTVSGLELGCNSSMAVGGTYSLSGSGRLLAANEYVGQDGCGVFSQSGGTNTVSSTLYLGYTFPENSGTYTLGGSGHLAAYAEIVGYAGSGTITQSGGTNAVSNTLCVGYNSFFGGSSGTYNLSGTGLLSAATEDIGASKGIFTQTGGTNIVSNTLWLGDTSGGTGTYNLNGGMLIVSSINGGPGAAAFNFNGGTLKIDATFFTSLPIVLGTRGGNATIDTGGDTVTLWNAFSGSGNLIKVGSGTLILGVPNTYTGDTTITAGTLQLNVPSAVQTGTVSVNVGNGLTFGPGIVAPAIGGLAGTGAVNLATTDLPSLPVFLTAGGDNANTTYSGSLSGAGGLIKTGSGELILAGFDTYTGGTTVNAGALYVTNPAALPDGTSLTVGAGAASIFCASVGNAPAFDGSLFAASSAGAAAVPEPSTLALLCAAGIVAAAAALRGRKWLCKR
ncbi:MAG: beta strand repeat-containing protein [Thermoguttaceae bacterium]